MAPCRLPVLPVALLWGCLLASSSPSTVPPPRDLRISDPGLLGPLDVQWEPPAHSPAFNQCSLKYRFEYRSSGDRDWKVVFTRKLKFRVGFDLSRRAEVRLQTLLKGQCTDDVELQSDWVYATFQTPPQGEIGSEVQNFHCIYHDWEYLKCTWQPGLLTPPGAHFGLYYWYQGLEQVVQCEHYLQEQGVNVGCLLHNLSQAEYQDLNICINGSAAAALLRPLYSTLHLHNLGLMAGLQVLQGTGSKDLSLRLALETCGLLPGSWVTEGGSLKLPATAETQPAAPRQLAVSVSAAQELRVAWSPPGGRVPPHCLEYEVQLAEDAGGAAWAFVSTQMETALTISRANQSHVSCVRVRGRTNIFCADQGFWSEWTQDCFSVSRKEDKQLFILIPVILSLSISLIIFMLIGQCKKRSAAGKPLHAPVGY